MRLKLAIRTFAGAYDNFARYPITEQQSLTGKRLNQAVRAPRDASCQLRNNDGCFVAGCLYFQGRSRFWDWLDLHGNRVAVE